MTQVTNRNKLLSWDERLSQAKSLWQRECEEAQRKASIAEQQRDEVSYQISLNMFEEKLSKTSWFAILPVFSYLSATESLLSNFS